MLNNVQEKSDLQENSDVIILCQHVTATVEVTTLIELIKGLHLIETICDNGVQTPLI